MITPKEKAIELVNKYEEHTMRLYADYDWTEDIESAKICALIAVDEILNLMIKEFKWDIKHNGNIEYWQEVKQEIEKL